MPRIPKLREYRERMALSQADLAGKAHVSRVTIISAEQGNPVRLMNIRLIADALGVSPAELMDRKGEE